MLILSILILFFGRFLNSGNTPLGDLQKEVIEDEGKGREYLLISEVEARLKSIKDKHPGRDPVPSRASL